MICHWLIRVFTNGSGNILFHVRQELINDTEGSYHVPSTITATDGVDAWSSSCDAARDSTINGTTPQEFWKIVASSFRSGHPSPDSPTIWSFIPPIADCKLQSPTWSFDRSSGVITVSWKLEYDKKVDLVNSFRSQLTAVKLYIAAIKVLRLLISTRVHCDGENNILSQELPSFPLIPLHS